MAVQSVVGDESKEVRVENGSGGKVKAESELSGPCTALPPGPAIQQQAAISPTVQPRQLVPLSLTALARALIDLELPFIAISTRPKKAATLLSVNSIDSFATSPTHQQSIAFHLRADFFS